jgi:alkanesulfonate monooxygenase SsuD/methylene tetrahydromethanopterin reductase-like flavin-dependent oxidoreductase (luciferase family)
MAPGPVQRPRPPLTIAAHGPTTVKLAARYADAWNTAGLNWGLDERATVADALRFTHDLSALLDEQAAAAGRAPGDIVRSVLAGFEWPVATADPWASVDAFREFVGRYRELGFTEFIVPEPAGGEEAVLEAVAGEALPSLRAGRGA